MEFFDKIQEIGVFLSPFLIIIAIFVVCKLKNSGVVSRLNGTESTEDARKEFMAKAMEATMLCSHLVSAVPTFSFVKITE